MTSIEEGVGESARTDYRSSPGCAVKFTTGVLAGVEGEKIRSRATVSNWSPMAITAKFAVRECNHNSHRTSGII